MQAFWITRVFWAIALGLFIDAYVYGVAAVSLSWVPHASGVSTLLLIWAPAVLSGGIVLGGWLADSMGRRVLLQLAPWGYMAGALVLFKGPGLIPTLAGTAILVGTAGLESNTILAYAQELVPEASRRRAITAELSFVNLGGVSLAALAYAGGHLGSSTLRDFIALVPLVLALFSVTLRRRLPESGLWQSSRLHTPMPHDYVLRFAVAAIFSIANTAGFSLISFAFGAEFLPRHFHHMLLISTATAFGVGLLSGRLTKLPPKTTLIVSYALALVMSLGLFWARRPTHPGFWPVLFLLSAFSSVSYITEDTITAKQWPTYIRARALAGARAAGLIGYATIVVVIQGARIGQFLAAMAGVWTAGLLAAIIWWIAGRSRTGTLLPWRRPKKLY